MERVAARDIPTDAPLPAAVIEPERPGEPADQEPDEVSPESVDKAEGFH